MVQRGDYVEKLANNIEQKLNLSRSDIKEMDREEFRNLLKNAYFSGKAYTKETRREPTDRQMDVLDLHYGKEVKLSKSSYGKFYYKDRKNNRTTYVSDIIETVDKLNRRRYRDGRTGRFVSKK